MATPSQTIQTTLRLVRVTRLIYLGLFLFGLHTQLINFADDILRTLGYLTTSQVERETGIQARGLSASVAQATAV